MNEVAAWVGERSESMRRHRRKKRKEGLCGYNGCKTPSELYLCPVHNQKATAARKKYNAAGLASG